MRNDITRRGERQATPEQIEKVRAGLMEHVGRARAISSKLLEARLFIDGRVVRAAIRELEREGVLLVGGGDDGVFVAEYQEEVEEKTNRDRAAAAALLERCEWRDHHMQRLPRKQKGLFD